MPFTPRRRTHSNDSVDSLDYDDDNNFTIRNRANSSTAQRVAEHLPTDNSIFIDEVMLNSTDKNNIVINEWKTYFTASFTKLNELYNDFINILKQIKPQTSDTSPLFPVRELAAMNLDYIAASDLSTFVKDIQTTINQLNTDISLSHKKLVENTKDLLANNADTNKIISVVTNAADIARRLKVTTNQMRVMLDSSISNFSTSAVFDTMNQYIKSFKETTATITTNLQDAQKKLKEPVAAIKLEMATQAATRELQRSRSHV